MITVRYFETPVSKVEISTAKNLGEYLLSRWDINTAPTGLRVYKNNISNETDITDLLLSKPELLDDENGEYEITIVPHGPEGWLIASVIIAVISVAAAFIFKPKVGVSRTPNQRLQSPNNALSSRENNPRVGERTSDIRGRVRSVPDLLMDYTVFNSNKEYNASLMFVSEGDVETTDIRDGETLCERISGTQVNVYGPHTSPGYGSPRQLIGGLIDLNLAPVMTVFRVNEVDGPELLPPNYSETVGLNLKFYNSGRVEATGSPTLDWTQLGTPNSRFELTDCYAWQPIAGSEGLYNRLPINGVYEITELKPQSVVLVIPDSLTTAWNLFSSTGFAAIKTAWVRNDVWRITSPSDSGWTMTSFTPRTALTGIFEIGPFEADNYDGIIVNLVANQGLYKSTGQNDYRVTVTLRLTGRNRNNHSQFIFHDIQLSSAKVITDMVGVTKKVINPYPQTDWSMIRITNTDKGFEGSVVDSIQWRDLYGFKNVTPRDYGDCTLLHTLTRATTAALQLKARKLNLWAKRKYNNTYSDMFADVVMSMHLDPLFGRSNINEIDVEGLYLVQQQLIDYFGHIDAARVGYTFDNDKITYEEGLQLICNAVEVTPYRIGSVIYFWPELPQDVSSMQFGHASKHPLSDKIIRSFKNADDYTGIEVQYFDENQKTFDTIQAGDPTALRKIELSGCISRKVAFWRVWREYNKLLYSRVNHEFDALGIGMQAVQGMRVDVVDNTRVMQTEGVVVDQDGLRLELSQPIDFSGSNSASIVLTKKDGSIEGVPCIPGDDEYEVILSRPSTEAIYTGWRRDRTSFVFSRDDERSKLAMLIQEVIPSGKDGLQKINIKTINYDKRYYSKDKTLE